MEVSPIGALVDGARARVRGRVRRAGELLTSGLGKRACVYWEVRESLRSAPSERGAQPFWLEDASGRVLVRAEALEVDARAERERAIVSAAESDVKVVSARLKALKDELREQHGAGAKPLIEERRRLAKVATLLCAIRAHARGNVHVGGTGAGQEAWIRKNRHLAEGGPGASTVKLAVDRWEVVVAEGDEVELEGGFHVEPLPPDLGMGGGYRDRPTCLVAHGEPDAPLRLHGVGAAAPVPDRPAAPAPAPAARAASAKPAEPARPGRRRPHDPQFERQVLAVVSVVATVSFILWLALR